MTNDFYCDFVLNHKIEVDKVYETDNVLAYYHTRPAYQQFPRNIFLHLLKFIQMISKS